MEERGATVLPLDVPPPPGVEPSVLAAVPTADQTAWLRLNEVTAKLAASWQAPPMPQEPDHEIEPVAETAAQRHYVRGREAALAGRHYQAITEFYRSLELDPYAVPVMRELARSHLALGNVGSASEFYSRIHQIDPSNAEAAFSMALAAANRREWDKAATMLASYFEGDFAFTHDPAADALAQFTYAVALRSLGYDRAAIEASRKAAAALAQFSGESIYTARLTQVHRQQSELWRGVGDAHCRLGEYESALEAYAIASALPSPDPSALHPRVVFANLRLGRVYTAQYELLAALQSQATLVSERDIRLCAYIADQVSDLALLREEVLQRYRENENEPDLVRAAAALLDSNEAAALLREFVERRPRDVHVAAQLLTWFGTRHSEEAVKLTARLIEAHPDLAGEYVSRLIFASPRPATLIDRAQVLGATPAAANIESRVLTALGALGEAWTVASEARTRQPHVANLLWLQIELAALLDDPLLLRQAVKSADDFDDAVTWMFRARAHRSLGETDSAIEAAERAMELVSAEDGDASDAQHTSVLVELALTYHAYALARPSEMEQRHWSHEAALLAENVLEREPDRESAHELLLTLYGPNSPLADSNRFREAAQRLLRSNPDSRLYGRLAAEELLGRGRYEEALERFLNLYDNDPADTRSLALAVEAWARRDNLDAARKWLTEKLRDRPGDPALLEQWVNVMLREDRDDDVVRALTDAIGREPRNYAAQRLLESTYRATGQLDRAFRYGERRLMAMPRGVRREVELAALYGGAGMETRALDIVEGLVADMDAASYDHLLAVVAILGRLEDNKRRRDELTLEYAFHIVDRFPQAPLQIYGLGMRALAKLGHMDARFDDFAQRAVESMPPGAGPQVVMLWRDLAQALLNAGEAGAAARALRPIIFAEHLHEPPASDVLALIAIVADAAVDPEQDRAERTITLVEDLAALGRLPSMPGMEPQDSPTIARTLYHASSIYSILGNDTGAQTLLRRVLSYAPNDAMALNNIGYVRIEEGRDDAETIAWIERAHELDPESPHILDTIGWLRYKQAIFEGDAIHGDRTDELNRDTGDSGKRLTGALSFIKAAIDAAEEPIAEVYDHLGDVYWRLGRDEEAVAAWEKAEQILSDVTRRQQIIQNLHALQVRGWGLLVEDAREMYDRMYGAELKAIRGKLEAVRTGHEPEIAPTFVEMKEARVAPHAATAVHE